MRTNGGVEEEIKESPEWKNPRSEVALGFHNETINGKNQVVISSVSGMERNNMFLNSKGKDFLNVSPLSGTDSIADGRGFAIWDYDRDGWQDLALVNTNFPHLQIFHNNHNRFPSQAANGFVAIQFVGGNDSPYASSEWTCRDGYGAVATVRAGNQNLVRELRCGEGFATQNSSTLIIGMGANQQAETISVRWPSGKKQVANDIRSGSLITFFENPTESNDSSGYQIASYKPAEPAQNNDNSIVETGPFLFDLPELQNDEADLRVFFTMATWCAACRNHMEFIADLKNKFGHKRVAFYGIPVDLTDDKEKLADYQEKLDVPYVILSGLRTRQRVMTEEYLQTQVNSDAMPSTIITDAAGQPLAAQLGIPTVSEISRLLENEVQ